MRLMNTATLRVGVRSAALSALAVAALVPLLWGFDGVRTLLNAGVLCLVSYPLTAASATYVAGRLRVSAGVSIALGILYAFLPYHWMAIERVYLSTSFWVVPPAVLVLVWLLSDRPPFFHENADGHRRFDPKTPRSVASVLIGGLLGATGVYFAYFAAILALVAGLVGALRSRRPATRLVSALLFVGAISITLLAVSATFPQARFTPQARVSAGTVDPDLSGLRITYLLLPIPDHRIGLAARLGRWYGGTLAASASQLVTDSRTAPLGVLGSMGFFILIAVSLFRPRLAWLSARMRKLVASLASLNLAAALVSIVGGFAAVASLGWQPVRAFTHMSPYIAYFCLLAPAVLADAAMKRTRQSRTRVLVLMLTAVAVILAILDQTPRRLPPAGAAMGVYSQGSSGSNGRPVRGSAPMMIVLPGTTEPDASNERP
jgi:hypothetical protein